MSPIYVPGKVTLAKDYTAGDRYFNETSLLLHGDGANGSTTIVDSSINALTITRGGNILPVISTDQSKYGGSSIFFNGSGTNIGYLDLPSSSLFTFPSDFTFECWVFVLTKGDAFDSTVIETAGNFTNGLVLRGDNTQANWLWSIGGNQIGGGLLDLNEWNHMAASRSGSTIRVFKDGVQQGSITNSVVISPAIGISRIGEGIFVTSRQLNGYIDDLRITKGVARYTANFTPPTAPFADGYY